MMRHFLLKLSMLEKDLKCSILWSVFDFIFIDVKFFFYNVLSLKLTFYIGKSRLIYFWH